MARRMLFYCLLAICLGLIARIGERHAFRLDLSTHRVNSLSASAERALEALPAALEITAFVPDYPVQRAQIDRLLAPYLDHADGIRFRYVDPIEEPEVAREHGVSRHGEIHLASGTRLEVIPVPSGEAIDLALNRLALKGERWIVALKGHGESEVGDTPGGLGRFVARLERLGYRVVALDPRQLEALPENTALLLIAGPREPYAGHSLALIEDHLDGGGPLLWLADGPLPDFFARDLGIGLLPGVVVDAAAARYQLESPDNAIVSELPADLLAPSERADVCILRRARGLTLDTTLDTTRRWRPQVRLQSSPRSWNETGGLQGSVSRDPEGGEQAGPLTVGVVMAPADGSDGGVALIGSRHLITNDQAGQGANLALAVGLVRWLTANRGLAAAAPAPGLEIHWSTGLAGGLALGLMAVLPAVYLVLGLWLRTRRRRA